MSRLLLFTGTRPLPSQLSLSLLSLSGRPSTRPARYVGPALLRLRCAGSWRMHADAPVNMENAIIVLKPLQYECPRSPRGSADLQLALCLDLLIDLPRRGNLIRNLKGHARSPRITPQDLQPHICLVATAHHLIARQGQELCDRPFNRPFAPTSKALDIGPPRTPWQCSHGLAQALAVL